MTAQQLRRRQLPQRHRWCALRVASMLTPTATSARVCQFGEVALWPCGSHGSATTCNRALLSSARMQVRQDCCSASAGQIVTRRDRRMQASPAYPASATPAPAAAPAASPWQLSIIAHGLSKRLIKANADATGPSRVLRLMSAWAHSHLLVDPSGGRVRITAISHALCEDLGYPAEEVLGGDLKRFMGPGTKAKAAHALVRCGDNLKPALSVLCSVSASCSPLRPA